MSYVQTDLNPGRRGRRTNVAVGCALSVLVLGIIVVGLLSGRHPSLGIDSMAVIDSSADRTSNSEVNDFFGVDTTTISARAGLSGQFVASVFSDKNSPSNGTFGGFNEPTSGVKRGQAAWEQIDNPSPSPVFAAVATGQTTSNGATNQPPVQQISGAHLPSLQDSFLRLNDSDHLNQVESKYSLDPSQLSSPEKVFVDVAPVKIHSARGSQQIQVEPLSPASLVVKPGWTADSAIRTKQLEQDAREVLQQVAATVDGTSISHQEILRRHAVYLKTLPDYMVKSCYQGVRSDEPTEDELRKVDEKFAKIRGEYEKLLRQLAKRDIGVFIQKKILFEYLQKNVTAEQWDRAVAWIDERFAQETDKLMRQLNVVTQSELEQSLSDVGLNLQQVKSDFTMDRLSNDCITIFCPKPIVLQPEIEEYYTAHLDEYRVASIADWQQICVPYSSRAELATATTKLESVLSDLASGRLFGDDDLIPADTDKNRLFKLTYLQTQLDDVKDVDLKRQVATAALDQWTPPFESSGLLCSIRVSHRVESRIKPLDEVQDEIRKTLLDAKHQDLLKQFLDGINSQAKIETSYELPAGLISPK